MSIPSPDIDEELFNDIYGKAYTPPASTANNGPQTSKPSKKSPSDKSDEEDEPKDPNAVPTDFTSREAKVWEAKAKATERNWKKRKEEEMICKLCGESGHFTQGCPSTLGANKKSADLFERVPARDKLVRSLFTDKVIQRIEKDAGCKIRMDEKFLFVSGKDRLILAKGVDAVHKIIQEGKEDGKKGNSSSPTHRSRSPPGIRSRSPPRNRSRSPPRNKASPPRKRSRSLTRKRSRSPENRYGVSHLRRTDSQKSQSSPRNSGFFSRKDYNQERASESQRSQPSPRNASFFPRRDFNQERPSESQLREDIKQLSRGSLQAFGNEGDRRHAVHSKSPHSTTFANEGYNAFDGPRRNGGVQMTNTWDTQSRHQDLHAGRNFDLPYQAETFEELEMEFKKEVMECVKGRDKEEDEEISRHRGSIRELREGYMKKLAIMREKQGKQWEEFLQLQMQRRQQAHHMAYDQPSYRDYDRTSGNPHYSGNNAPVDPRSRYQYGSEDYSGLRAHEGYGEFQRQAHDGFGKSYGRY